jgi:hypothetical protein
VARKSIGFAEFTAFSFKFSGGALRRGPALLLKVRGALERVPAGAGILAKALAKGNFKI